MEEIPPLAVTHTWDVGKLVPQACGDQDTAGAHRAAVGQGHKKAGSRTREDAGDSALDHQSAIALHLSASDRKELVRGKAVTGEKAVQVSGQGVARCAGVHHMQGVLSRDGLTRLGAGPWRGPGPRKAQQRHRQPPLRRTQS